MDWQCIYTTRTDYKAELARALLADFEIESTLVSKKDSLYHFGDLELYVAPDDVIKAKQILTKKEFE